MIKHSNDQEIVADCIQIIGYFAETYKKMLKFIYEHNILHLVVKLLE